jgi:hypothetical protein
MLVMMMSRTTFVRVIKDEMQDTNPGNIPAGRVRNITTATQ